MFLCRFATQLQIALRIWFHCAKYTVPYLIEALVENHLKTYLHSWSFPCPILPSWNLQSFPCITGLGLCRQRIPILCRTSTLHCNYHRICLSRHRLHAYCRPSISRYSITHLSIRIIRLRCACHWRIGPCINLMCWFTLLAVLSYSERCLQTLC